MCLSSRHIFRHIHLLAKCECKDTHEAKHTPLNLDICCQFSALSHRKPQPRAILLRRIAIFPTDESNTRLRSYLTSGNKSK